MVLFFRFSSIYLILSIAAVTRADNKTTLWLKSAHRLIGETPEVRNKSLAELQNIKNLDEILNVELNGSHRAQALDVIVTLQKQNFLPQLLGMLETDKDGILTLAINGLLNEENKAQISKAYLAHLERVQTLPAASTVAIIDALGRMGNHINSNLLSRLMRHPYFEIRSAVLGYLRIRKIQHGILPAVNVVHLGFKDQPMQIRMQTAFFVTELQETPLYKNLRKHCLSDTLETIRQVCQTVTTVKPAHEPKTDTSKDNI